MPTKHTPKNPSTELTTGAAIRALMARYDKPRDWAAVMLELTPSQRIMALWSLPENFRAWVADLVNTSLELRRHRGELERVNRYLREQRHANNRPSQPNSEQPPYHPYNE